MSFHSLILIVIMQISYHNGQEMDHWFTDLFDRPVPFPHSPGRIKFLVDMSKQTARAQLRAAIFYPKVPIMLHKDDSVEFGRQIYNASQAADSRGHPPVPYIMRVDDAGRTLFQRRVNWSLCSDASDVCQDDSRTCYAFMRDITKLELGKAAPKFPVPGEQLSTYCLWTDMESGPKQCDLFNKSICWSYPFDWSFVCTQEGNETFRDICVALSKRHHVVTISKSQMPIRPKDNPCVYPHPDHPTVRLMLNNRTLPVGSHHLFNGSMRFQVFCSPQPGSHARLEVCQLWSWQNRTRCKNVKCGDFVRVWRHKNDTPVLYRFEVAIFVGKNIYRNIESYAYIYLIYVPKPKLSISFSGKTIICSIDNFGIQVHGIFRTNLVIHRRGSTPDRISFHTNSTIIVQKHPKVVSYACRAKVRFRTCNPFVDHFSKLAIVYLDTEAAPATLPNYNTTTTRRRLFLRSTTTARFFMIDEEYYDVPDDPRLKGTSMTTIVVCSLVGGAVLIAAIVGGGILIMKRMNKRQKQERTARKLSRKLRSKSKSRKKVVTFLKDEKSKRSRSIKSIQTSQQSGRSSKRGVGGGRRSGRSSSRTFSIGPPLGARSTGRLTDKKSMGRLSRRKSIRPSLSRKSLVDKKLVGRSSLGKKSAVSSLRKKP